MIFFLIFLAQAYFSQAQLNTVTTPWTNVCSRRDEIYALQIPRAALDRVVLTFFTPYLIPGTNGDFAISFDQIDIQAALNLGGGITFTGFTPRELQILTGIPAGLIAALFDSNTNNEIALHEIRGLLTNTWNILDRNNDNILTRAEFFNINANLQNIAKLSLDPFCWNRNTALNVITRNPILQRILNQPYGGLLEIIIIRLFKPDRAGVFRVSYEKLVKRMKNIVGPSGVSIRILRLARAPMVIDYLLDKNRDDIVTPDELKIFVIIFFRAVDINKDYYITNTELDTVDPNAIVREYLAELPWNAGFITSPGTASSMVGGTGRSFDGPSDLSRNDGPNIGMPPAGQRDRGTGGNGIEILIPGRGRNGNDVLTGGGGNGSS